jgi:hypothetical protein
MDTLLVGNGSARITLSDSSYESLVEAPEDSTLYVEFIGVFLGEAYVIRTREGHYAKFRIPITPGPGLIEYTYQDDGSRALAEPVAVEETTWGRIKALYEEEVP